MSLSIKLKLEGFDELLKKIEKAGGSVDDAAMKAVRKGAEIMESELKAQMQAADENNQMSNLIARMPSPTIENDYGEITATVGYPKDAYDPDNISDAYKVIFINYGTPRKFKKNGDIWIKPRGFIQEAKKRAKPKIRKEQEKILDEIFRGLK